MLQLDVAIRRYYNFSMRSQDTCPVVPPFAEWNKITPSVINKSLGVDVSFVSHSAKSGIICILTSLGKLRYLHIAISKSAEINGIKKLLVHVKVM